MDTEQIGSELEKKGWLEKPTSRISFLRRLGMLAAAGTVAVLLPGTAKAGNAVCCPNACSRSCDPGLIPFRCQDSCSGTTCCVCFSPATDCIVKPCLC
jgi:hypothetical protein